MPYTLDQISRVEEPSIDTFRVSSEYLLYPADPATRTEFYEDYLGGVRYINGVFVYVWPKRDAVFNWLYATSITVNPIAETDTLKDVSESLAEYNSGKLKVTVVYEPRVIDEVDLIRRERDYSVRHLTLPQSFMKWKEPTGGETVGSNPLIANDGIAAVKPIPQTEFNFTRYFVESEPADAINSLTGRVNEKSMYIGRDFFRKETLRFNTAKTSQRITNRGVKYWEIVYNFSIATAYDKIVEWSEIAFDADPDEMTWVGWNRLYNPRLCKWQRVVDANDETRNLYQYDTDVPRQKIRGKEVEGFNLLFYPGAK